MQSKDQIAIICSTFYPSWYQGPLRSIHHTDKVRGDLSLEFIEKALALGYWVVVSDGFSTKTYQRKVVELKTDKLILLKRKKQNNRSEARRTAFFRAAKIPNLKIIVYSEAEKFHLLDSIDEISLPILRDQAEIVIPKRDSKLFRATFPPFQYQSEIEGNLLYNEYLHLHGLLKQTETLDLFFGPRVFKVTPRVLNLFYQRYRFQVGSHVLNQEYFNPEELSDYLFFPIVVALQRKLRVSSVEIPFRYPLLQKQNEEHGNPKFFEEKRKMQRLSLLVELMHFVNYLERQKK